MMLTLTINVQVCKHWVINELKQYEKFLDIPAEIQDRTNKKSQIEKFLDCQFSNYSFYKKFNFNACIKYISDFFKRNSFSSQT